MAHDEDSQERLNEQNEAHIKLLIRLESEYNRYGGGLKKVINDSITAMKKENLTSLERAKLQNKMVHDLHTEMSSLTKGIKEGKKTQQDLWDATKELSAAMEVVTDEAERSTLASVRRDAAFQASGMAFNENLSKLSETIARTTVSTSARFATQLQTGMSAATAGAGMMNGVIDIVGAGAGATGRVISAFGGAVALTNPALGLFTAGLGSAVSFLAETGSALAKFGVQIAKVEVEKTISAFNTLSSSGAMFADGMTGMRAAAGEAKLTLAQFTAIVKSSSSQLSDSGMSVGEASEFTGRVLAKGGDSMKKSLANLGYSFEEQGELVAQVMKDMRGSSVGPLTVSDTEVAEQTQKYAENLRIIADITGEDAKGKMEEARNSANQLAFQQKMSKMSDTERDNVMNAMGNMSKQQQMDFMDMVNFGAVINKSGRLMAAQIPEYSSSLKESTAMFKNKTLDDTKQRDINAKHQEGINKQVMANTGMGTAGAAHLGGDSESQAAAQLDLFNFNKKQTKVAIDNATKDTKKQRDTTDVLTTSLVGAEVSLQTFQRAMEEDLTPVIAQFGKFTMDMLDELEDKMEDLGLMTTDQLNERAKKKAAQDTRLDEKAHHDNPLLPVESNWEEWVGEKLSHINKHLKSQRQKDREEDNAKPQPTDTPAPPNHAAGTLGVDKSLFKSVPGGEVIRAFEDGPEAVITKDQFDSVVKQVQALTKSSMGAKSTISMANSKFNATTGVPQTATGAENMTIKQALRALVDFGKLMKTNVTPALTDFGEQLHDLLDGLGTQQLVPSDEDDEYMPMSRDMDTGEETAMNYTPQGTSGGTSAGVQGVPGGGGGANFRKPSDADVAAARSAKPTATREDQKAYWQKMHDALLKSATDKGVLNPEAIASLGADQSSLETGYGKHMVGNNAFGIKAKKGAGQVSASTQEFENGRMVTKQQNFRAYDKPEDSTNDYVDFLLKNKRYAAVLAAKNSDEAVAAQAKTGYATDPNYGRKLASINNAMKGQVKQPAAGDISSDQVTAAQRVLDITDQQLAVNKKQQDLAAKHSTAIQPSSMVMKPAEGMLAGMANAIPAQGQVKQPAASGIATPSIPASTQTATEYGESVPATQAHKDAGATAAAVKPTDITATSHPSSPDKHRELMTEALRLLSDIKTAMITGNKINQKTATNTA